MDSERKEAGCRTREVGESSELTTAEAERFFDEEGGAEDGGRRGSEAIGRSGNIVEGAGFGEGMLRSDSFDARRRVGTTGTGGIIAIGFSVRLRGR